MNGKNCDFITYIFYKLNSFPYNYGEYNHLLVELHPK